MTKRSTIIALLALFGAGAIVYYAFASREHLTTAEKLRKKRSA
jgi:hypothetical protein